MLQAFRRGSLVVALLLSSACDASPVPGDGGPAPDAGPPMDAATGSDARVLDANLPDVVAPCLDDDDGDGHLSLSCGGDDCDDTDATRFPGNAEVCDAFDGDCDSTTFGVDADGDGFESAACCNEPGSCGPDCDDTLNTVNPGAAEQCNGGVDDDCDGLADSADGVCVPCAVGYSGFDGDCTDIDECVTSGFCGTGASGCTNVPGTFVCTCGAGYRTASPVGALCESIDECAAASNPCGAGACTDNAGSYVCTCPSGYRLATSPAITCLDVDECVEGSDFCTEVPAATCANTAGSYACTCPAGYEGSGRGGGGCTDVEECARDLDDCVDVVGLCTNRVGGFDCGCVTGWTGSGHGPGSCAWNDPSLTDLAVGAAGTLSPVFSPGTTSYMLTLLPGVTSTSLTPTVAQPARTTITVAGASVASGTSAVASLLGSGFAPRVLDIVVATETGATRTYTVVVRRGSTYVKASNTGSFDHFGAVVSQSADGTRLAVSAPGEASSATGVNGNQADNSANGAGAVYVFLRTGTTWAQEAYVKASNTAYGDSFGASVSLSADGTRLAVGAPGEDSISRGINGAQLDDSAFEAGAVYVFTRSGTTWAQEAYVKASNTEDYDASGIGAVDRFGTSVSLSADGTRLAVGATGEDSSARGINGNQADNGAEDSGAVYVFSRSGTTWAQEAYVKASNADAGDAFGGAVSFSADGMRLAVSAPWEDSSARGVGGAQADNSAANSGAVYVFSRSGTTWSQQAYVKASNTGANDQFGTALSLAAVGTRLAVGAFLEASSARDIDGDGSDDSAVMSGAVYVFSWSGTAWAQEAYVKASNTEERDSFGSAVSLSADGSRLAVGAILEDSPATGIGGTQVDNGAASSGAVYVFSRSGTTWAHETFVKASNTGAGDSFGSSVSLSADGTRLAAGSRREASNATGIGGNQANNSDTQAGAVYVY